MSNKNSNKTGGSEVAIESVGVSIPIAVFNECAHGNQNKNGQCLNKDDITNIVSIINQVGIDKSDNKEIGGSDINTENQLINVIQNATPSSKNCETSGCILDEFQSKVAEKDVQLGNILRMIIDKRFKPSGPWNSTEWLSDRNIENTLKQLIDAKDNFAILGFKMLDEFTTPDKDFELIEEYRKKGKTKIAFVANQDISTGTGIHWVALFLDFEPPQITNPNPNLGPTKCNIKEVGFGSYSSPFTIEFFNSAGGSIYKEILTWATHIQCLLCSKGFVSDIIQVSEIQHQQENTECGVYSIYYIISRLEGYPYTNFSGLNKGKISKEHLIPDGHMEKFRESLFRHSLINKSD